MDVLEETGRGLDGLARAARSILPLASCAGDVTNQFNEQQRWSHEWRWMSADLHRLNRTE